jgi:hypothetical protein
MSRRGGGGRLLRGASSPPRQALLAALLALVAAAPVRASSQAGQPDTLRNGAFTIVNSPSGIQTFKKSNDRFDTDYILHGEPLGEVVLRYRVAGGSWREISTAGRPGRGRAERKGVSAQYAIVNDLSLGGRGQVQVGQLFTLQGDSLVWLIRVRNLTDSLMEIGDLALPLPFNNRYGEDGREIFERRVIRHHYIGGDGSFLFWMRPSGIGPYLLMTPNGGTSLEYLDLQERGKDPPPRFSVYVHSLAKGRENPRGNWRQPHTSVVLRGQKSPGGQVTYGFTFRWVPDYQGVRDLLASHGSVDFHVIPGMTLPVDLAATVAVRTRNAIDSLVAEHPAQTRIESLGARGEYRLFRVHFQRLGENLLTLRYGRGESTILEFFVTEPLDVLIRKRSSFLVANQQHREKEKWYNGLFSQWDMRHRVLRGPDDPDGFTEWWGYVLACDDPVLGKAPFIAAKNVIYPNRREIRALEYHISNYVWGRLQYTDRDTPYPYGIFGVPNYRENRAKLNGRREKGGGVHHVWRTYDYPHLVKLYFHLYQIAKWYPGLTTSLTASEYLGRAYGTARAMFTVPQMIFPVHEAITWASYNELVILPLIDALASEGFAEQAAWLRNEWDKKVKYFIYDDPYPYRSEYNFDATAFESTQAFASYAVRHPMRPDTNLWYDERVKAWRSHPAVSVEAARAFMDRQMAANLACRGVIEPAYYTLGSDYRGESARYLLSYMSQMGGGAVLEYGLHFAPAPGQYLRTGYASILSSWALMNTGTPESDYGYWYPGPENDGAAGWAFEPQKTTISWIRKDQSRGAWFYDGEIDLGFGGALRSAATIVSEDPVFGLIALGGSLTAQGDTLEVIPRDGVRQRLHLLTDTDRLHLALDRDGFAAEKQVRIARDGSWIGLEIENRSSTPHDATLSIGGIPGGAYAVFVEDLPAGTVEFSSEGEGKAALPIPARASINLRLHRRAR